MNVFHNRRCKVTEGKELLCVNRRHCSITLYGQRPAVVSSTIVNHQQDKASGMLTARADVHTQTQARQAQASVRDHPPTLINNQGQERNVVFVSSVQRPPEGRSKSRLMIDEPNVSTVRQRQMLIYNEDRVMIQQVLYLDFNVTIQHMNTRPSRVC